LRLTLDGGSSDSSSGTGSKAAPPPPSVSNSASEEPWIGPGFSSNPWTGYKKWNTPEWRTKINNKVCPAVSSGTPSKGEPSHGGSVEAAAAKGGAQQRDPTTATAKVSQGPRAIGSAEPAATSYTPSKLTLRDQWIKWINKLAHMAHCAELGGITCGMALVETPDKVILVVIGFAIVSNVVLDLSLQSVPLAVVALVLFVLFLGGSVQLTKRVEHMEIVSAKYRAADTFLKINTLQKEEDDAAPSASSSGGQVPALGPLALSAKDLRQSDPQASSLSWLRGRAEELSVAFEDDILGALHAVCAPGGVAVAGSPPKANLKGISRAYEKAVLDYGKDFRLLKDMLRGSIVCSDLDHLRRVWTKVEELQSRGICKILQIKNRFRGNPFATGRHTQLTPTCIYKICRCIN
jgi:hypothetical protein